MNITRRNFISLGAGTMIAGTGYKLGHAYDYPIIESVIEQNLSALNLSLEIRSKFKTDFLDYIREYHANDGYLIKLTALSMFSSLYTNPNLKKSIPKYILSQITQFEESVVTKLLLSTNTLFRKDGEEIKYIIFYNPYKRGCSNPLAKI